MKNYASIFLLLLIASLSGCVAVRPAVPPANRAISQLYQGNLKEAWTIISTEMAHPTVFSQEDLCELEVSVLQILQLITRSDFAPPDPDSVAKKSYDYVIKNCGAFRQKQCIVENLYGAYFMMTSRSGLAIPHIKKSLVLSDDAFNKMNNEASLATAYANMGQFELRDFHKLKATKIGSEHFKTKRTYTSNLNEANQFLEYKKILESRLDNLSWSEDRSGALPEMHQRWDEIKTINGKWGSQRTQYLAYIFASQRFAGAGDTVFARTLLNEAE